MRAMIAMFAVFVLLFGCSAAPQKNESVMEKDAVNKTGGSMNKSGNSMEKNGSVGTAMETKKYVPFTKSAYDQARAEHKVIFLEFYANWCPICAAQAPELEAAFAEIKDPDVVAFRVNYKDSDTDADEQALAREFGITYQHTHVILGSDGSVKKKSTGETWSKETIISEVQKVAQ
jgi:thiol:disulfide interchange protein